VVRQGKTDRIEGLARRLGRTPLFASLDREHRRELAAAGRRRSLRRGQQLWRRGARPDSVALVLDGRLDVTRHTEAGALVLLRSLAPGSLVGLSTVAGAAHSADVVAGRATQVLVIPGAALREVVAGDPEAVLRWVVQLADYLAELSSDVEELREHDLGKRLRMRIARIGRGRRELEITHGELAAQVGATRANVSRALKRLEAEGILRRRRGRIELS